MDQDLNVASINCAISEPLRSGQIWRLSLNHFRDSASDLKTIATFGQNGVVTYTQLVSLSRGSEIAQFMLAAWAPMTRRCVAFFSDWCVCFFVKYWQDGFTKIQTPAMTWRGVAFCFGLVRLFLCKILQDGLQKNKRAQWHDDALLFVSDWCVCFFVKYWQDGFTKIQTQAMTWRCVAFCFGLVRLYLCKILARWVYNDTVHCGEQKKSHFHASEKKRAWKCR